MGVGDWGAGGSECLQHEHETCVVVFLRGGQLSSADISLIISLPCNRPQPTIAIGVKVALDIHTVAPICTTRNFEYVYETLLLLQPFIKCTLEWLFLEQESHNGFLTYHVRSGNLLRDLDGKDSLQHSAQKP